jgi:hydrogenase maturation protein HypF
MTLAARSIHVRGVVQGVGFRPFVFRLARARALAGWVSNVEDGVAIHIEGAEAPLRGFLSDLATQPPAAAQITAIEIEPSEPAGLREFTIIESRSNGHPSVRISADLPVCDECLRELFDPSNPRYFYPYINCTNCGPRYSVIERLPYDRPNTTMKHWALDELCAAAYHDPADRRFHAQPTACPACGPHYDPGIGEVAELLNDGAIVAIKGIGGYHLACDAHNVEAVRALRDRKYRKEKPFALMTPSIEKALDIVQLSPEAEKLLISAARPIVLAPARVDLPEVAPGNDELGVMLPYAPLHHLLFASGAPRLLVMTSANRSSEPIAYKDDDARDRLSGIADAFLVGERPIARRVDDSVARAGVFGPVILRRSRGYAPGAVATLPTRRPILALGADLKNAITLVVDGQAFVSQHIGDLDHYEAFQSFQETVADLTAMYEVDIESAAVAHDAHPQYASTTHALDLRCGSRIAVQHHRAHIASVLAERGAFDTRVTGVSFDGTGYGDDGAIWGGEFFVGSIAQGLERVMHLRKTSLPGGDAAARYPVQCAAGFLNQLEHSPDFTAPPFHFPSRYRQALQLLEKQLRTFETTSMGRLFDAVAALTGFTREITFEGQAAMWLEHLARHSQCAGTYPFPEVNDTLDFVPLLEAIVDDRLLGRDPADIARAFHRSAAAAVCCAADRLSEAYSIDTLVLSGGVFQNELLLADIRSRVSSKPIRIWTNSAVPPNDGGISLGQAAIACMNSPSR